jgi:hypothetical protein
MNEICDIVARPDCVDELAEIIELIDETETGSDDKFEFEIAVSVVE